MTTDSRLLFRDLTTRKPHQWDDATLRLNLSAQQRSALRSLPVVSVCSQPLEDFTDATGPMEFIAIVDGRSFYVNTEGATYARYAFEFNNNLLED